MQEPARQREVERLSEQELIEGLAQLMAMDIGLRMAATMASSPSDSQDALCRHYRRHGFDYHEIFRQRAAIRELFLCRIEEEARSWAGTHGIAASYVDSTLVPEIERRALIRIGLLRPHETPFSSRIANRERIEVNIEWAWMSEQMEAFRRVHTIPMKPEDLLG